MPLHRKVLVLLYRHSPTFQVLLLKRKDRDEWAPVTGLVERHEEPRAAAMREVLEETGHEVEPEPLGVTFTFEKTGGRFAGRYHETAYGAKAEETDVELSDEHADHAWLSPEEARTRLAWDGQKRALDGLVARYGAKAA